jgi:hypothetical protein
MFAERLQPRSAASASVGTTVVKNVNVKTGEATSSIVPSHLLVENLKKLRH